MAAGTGVCRPDSALRQSGVLRGKRRLGESAPAEDVAQVVFTRLARSPPRVGTDAEVVAWLHRTTVHAAIDFWRGETRRRSREQQAALMQPTSAEDSRVWEELSPHLDQALDGLNDPERQAALMRFYEGKAMREIGRALGVSEDAAKMRVSRAVDRLRAQLSLKGVVCTGGALVTLLPQCGVEAAPAQLLARLGTIQRKVRAAAGAGTVSSLMPSIVKSPAFQRAALVAGVGMIAIVLFRNVGGTGKQDQAMNAVANPPGPARPQAVSAVGRVVDEAGNPLAGAIVRTDYDFKRQIHTRFDWLTNTDAQGRFEWDSAPAEAICFWFEADGFEIIRGQPMCPDGTAQEISLRRKANRLEREP